jgi:hypothetical protein
MVEIKRLRRLTVFPRSSAHQCAVIDKKCTYMCVIAHSNDCVSFTSSSAAQKGPRGQEPQPSAKAKAPTGDKPMLAQAAPADLPSARPLPLYGSTQKLLFTTADVVRDVLLGDPAAEHCEDRLSAHLISFCGSLKQKLPQQALSQAVRFEMTDMKSRATVR